MTVNDFLDDYFKDWSLEDCQESKLPEQFFRDYHSSRRCLLSTGESLREKKVKKRLTF